MSLNGRVEKTDVPTLLRSVEKDKNSGELSFNRSGDRVDLYFLFGQLYHAKWGSVVGVDAVMEVLNWTTGNYIFTEGIIPAQASINDDIERILATKAPSPSEARAFSPGAALSPYTGSGQRHSANSTYNPEMNNENFDLIPFDLASLDSMNAVYPGDGPPPVTNKPQTGPLSIDTYGMHALNAAEEAMAVSRVAPAPPSGGLYRTQLFCLPTGEQMATSLVATGPQLEEELLHLAEVRFTGYVLGGPEVLGYPTVGICLLRGRFIHAFYHLSGPTGTSLLEGERAYRTALDQRGSSAARFYWFYELTTEIMRAAIALLTPPTRYSHLEVRILRFKELLRLLNEESFTGTLRISIPNNALNSDHRPSQMAGERAYIPVYQGTIMGLWSESTPRMTNDGQLLQRFLNETQAFLDLHATATVADPGMPLESLIAAVNAPPVIGNVESAGLSRQGSTGSLNKPGNTANLSRPGNTGNLNRSIYAEPAIPVPPPVSMALPVEPAQDTIDDDERQLYLITSIGRMEATWTTMQKKGRIDEQTMLLALAGFANEGLSIIEGVSGRRGVQDMLQRVMKNELAPYRTIFQLLDIAHGRVNIGKLLREYELFNKDSVGQADDFVREAGRGLRTLLRSAFQHYVSLIRSETTRFEAQDMYEVFLMEVVKKM